jgi:hypothetical protein
LHCDGAWLQQPLLLPCARPHVSFLVLVLVLLVTLPALVVVVLAAMPLALPWQGSVLVVMPQLLQLLPVWLQLH